jgi:hypothetical protein
MAREIASTGHLSPEEQRMDDSTFYRHVVALSQANGTRASRA